MKKNDLILFANENYGKMIITHEVLEETKEKMTHYWYTFSTEEFIQMITDHYDNNLVGNPNDGVMSKIITWEAQERK